MSVQRWFWLPLVFASLVSGCTTPSPDCAQLEQDQAVGNAGCLVLRPGAVLLVQQRLGGAWGIPGGTAEPGERAACTAARETREETGLEVRVLEHLQVMDNGFHIFRCEVAIAAALAPVDGLEIQAAAWIPHDERPSLPWRFPAQRAPVEALIQALE